MPKAGHWWWHIVLNARGTWLTGDPRGFRSRNHRKHSTGDYKLNPPTGEHAGLHQAVQSVARPAVKFHPQSWQGLGTAILTKARASNDRIAVLSVDQHHVHLLAELFDDRAAVKRQIGQWKQAASHRVRDQLPGRIWASSCDPIRIRGPQHQANAYRYIRDHRNQGAWVWCEAEQRPGR